MTYLAGDQQVMAARIAGSVAGVSISLVYMLPKGRREAAARLATGLVAGLVFGAPAGLYGAEKLGLVATLSAPEIVLSGAAAVSMTAWWVLGALKRMAERWGR